MSSCINNSAYAIMNWSNSCYKQVGNYFHDTLLFWRPRLLFNLDFRCSHKSGDRECGQRMTSAGIYGQVRRVIDSRGIYYLGTEAYSKLWYHNRRVYAWHTLCMYFLPWTCVTSLITIDHSLPLSCNDIKRQNDLAFWQNLSSRKYSMTGPFTVNVAPYTLHVANKEVLLEY